MKFLHKILTALFTLSAVIASAPIPAAGQEQAQSTAIQQAVEELNNYTTLQKSLGLQDPDLSLGMRKALILAELLINPAGQINTSLCTDLKANFVPQNPLEYEITIGRILDQLSSNHEWQLFFDTVKMPNDPKSTANLVIRGLFGLSPKDAITDWHAKVAVLSALFAPCNQGPVGDCFAICDLVRDHREYYFHTAHDCAEIIQNGFITRTGKNLNDNFFFLPILADYDAGTLIQLNTSGIIPGTSTALLDAPGFAAAWKAMGGGAIPPKIYQALAYRYEQPTPASEIINFLAQQIAYFDSSLDKDTLAQQGNYAYCCLTNNPVLRAVEACFASMAEDRPQDSTRGNINDCISQSLASTWKAISTVPIAKKVKKHFDSNFNNSYRLIYNFNIPLAQVSADGNSTDGGFQLYKRNPKDPTSIGTRVETPEDFRNLVLEAAELTSVSFGGNYLVRSMTTQLVTYIKHDDFLKNALWAYDSQNQKVSDPIGNYTQLARSPMQSCDGDNPYEVDDIDTGHTFDSSIEQRTVKNAQDLVSWCLVLTKRQLQGGLYPMNSPQHAFNFVPNLPELIPFAKSSLSTSQWINQILIAPGMKVASSKMDSATQDLFANRVYSAISNAIPNQQKYQSIVNKLNSQSLNVQHYAQGLVNGITRLLQADASATKQISLLVDSILIQSLPTNDKAAIQRPAIRFAFTNWNAGTKDIYFCAFFNPRTCKVAFGNIEENKENLQPMDEDAWVNNQQWDIDLHPLAPPNEATGT